MTNLALHPDTPPQRLPLTATVSAPTVDAVASDTDKDLYTDLTDATDCLQEKIRVFRVHPCTKNTMTDIVIQAENLGKQYTIGHQAENGRYVTLRDGLVQNARRIHSRCQKIFFAHNEHIV